MEMTESIDDQVMDFVAKEVPVNRTKISPSTTLFGDLGIDGDDALEFLQAYAEHFGVNIEGLKFTDHFGPEGFEMLRFLWIIIQTIKWNDPHTAAGKVPITIEDLIRAASTKKWAYTKG